MELFPWIAARIRAEAAAQLATASSFWLFAWRYFKEAFKNVRTDRPAFVNTTDWLLLAGCRLSPPSAMGRLTATALVVVNKLMRDQIERSLNPVYGWKTVRKLLPGESRRQQQSVSLFPWSP